LSSDCRLSCIASSFERSEDFARGPMPFLIFELETLLEKSFRGLVEQPVSILAICADGRDRDGVLDIGRGPACVAQDLFHIFWRHPLADAGHVFSAFHALDAVLCRGGVVGSLPLFGLGRGDFLGARLDQRLISFDRLAMHLGETIPEGSLCLGVVELHGVLIFGGGYWDAGVDSAHDGSPLVVREPIG
jgi:hypothetical protein